MGPRTFVVGAVLLAACGSSNDGGSPSGDGGTNDGAPGPDGAVPADGGADSTSGPDGTTPTGTSPTIAGCPIFPASHVFNTPIDGMPVHPNSAAFLTTIGTHNLHLDLGTTVDPQSGTYYGIPYNVVHGGTGAWTPVHYRTADTSMSWDPTQESDCPNGSAHTLVSPCLASTATQPQFPMPQTPLVEGGTDTTPSQPYGDHHILLLDQDACRLYELYHAYPSQGGGAWDIFGSAAFDLKSNTLRPDGWTSADAAGFSILALLLRADEASAGKIRHALRFTIQSSKIRTSYTWPARHLTTNGTASTNLPPMGQLFRLKASYTIPANFGTQARAILQAMKTYGMYIADGGSDMYVSGEPNAAWDDATFSQMQSVSSGDFEAVDLTPIQQRKGFDPNSAAVPPP